MDECAAIPGLCSPHGTCVNALGSYRCICDRGFAPEPGSGGTRCADVDECAVGAEGTRGRGGGGGGGGISHSSLTSPCQDRCVNTEGSFVCTCPDGHALNADGRTCRLIG